MIERKIKFPCNFFLTTLVTADRDFLEHSRNTACEMFIRTGMVETGIYWKDSLNMLMRQIRRKLR